MKKYYQYMYMYFFITFTSPYLISQHLIYLIDLWIMMGFFTRNISMNLNFQLISDIFCFFTKNVITTLTGQRSVLLIYNIFLYLSSFMKWYQICFYLFWLLIIRRDHSNPISIATTITLTLLFCTRFVRVDIWNGRKTTEHIHLDIVIKYSFNVNITYINNTIYIYIYIYIYI